MEYFAFICLTKFFKSFFFNPAYIASADSIFLGYFPLGNFILFVCVSIFGKSVSQANDFLFPVSKCGFHIFVQFFYIFLDFHPFCYVFIGRFKQIKKTDTVAFSVFAVDRLIKVYFFCLFLCTSKGHEKFIVDTSRRICRKPDAFSLLVTVDCLNESDAANLK